MSGATDGLTFRAARRDDVETIVAMLADDALGSTREQLSPLPESYHRAFEAIARDANIELIVGCLDGAVVAVAQLSFTPHLSYRGGWRATVEGVRTAASVRSRGVGGALMRHAIERARQRNCHVIQLTTDKRRADARRFYERLGFRATHEGMKLHLHDAAP